ncbi:MAG: TonB-dependent receptor, partial [Cyclobacteriaceae bacterium]|nr:TonB-dependent receptor [Cyclobacteriaceae bacterium]
LSIAINPSIFDIGEEIVIEADRDDRNTSNEFTYVSGQSFTAEKTQRIAGSINDPGRMAVSLPGVQFSQFDNQNTMIVRANSPFGLAWKLEGMEIPNPNHFADVGSSGGGISALSVFVLGESDFLSGAFAAEYGNAYAGVMDTHFRKGNTDSWEHRIQAGIIGLDIASEGPLSGKPKDTQKASYLFNYRYSTLGILGKMGVRVVKPDLENVFQDLSFNLFFPVSKKTFITLYGLGGISNETKFSNLADDSTNCREYYFPTRLGVTGTTLTHLIDDKSYLYVAGSFGYNSIADIQDTVSFDGTPFTLSDEYYKDQRLVLTMSYNRQPNRRLNIKTGVTFTDFIYDVHLLKWDYTNALMRRQNEGKGSSMLYEGYVQGIYRLSENFSVNAGLHAQLLGLNKDGRIEPRAAVAYQNKKGTNLSLAYGEHSRNLPFNFYETTITDGANNILSKPNRDLKMIKARHFIAMFDQRFAGMRLKVEPFYQRLSNVPVSVNPSSTYSAINQDEFFVTDTLLNTGEGINQGVEVTLEKFFYNQLFFMLSGTFYDSKYKMNNGGPDKWYDTRYNNKMNISLSAGKEWKISDNKLFEAGGRMIYGGGLRYTPIDEVASKKTGEPVFIQEEAFSLQAKEYFRIDARLAYRVNKPNISWKLSLDIQNLTNRDNVRRPFYNRYTNAIQWDPQ